MLQDEKNTLPFIDLSNKVQFYVGHLRLTDNEALKKINYHTLNCKDSVLFLYSDNAIGLYKLDLYIPLFNDLSPILVKNNSIIILIGGLCDNPLLFNNQEISPNIILCNKKTMFKTNNKTGLILSGGLNKEVNFLVEIYRNFFDLNQHCFSEFSLNENQKQYDLSQFETEFLEQINDIDIIISPFFPSVQISTENKDVITYISYNENIQKKINDNLITDIQIYQNDMKNVIGKILLSLAKNDITLITGDMTFGPINGLNFKTTDKNILWYNNYSNFNTIEINTLSTKEKNKKLKKKKIKVIND